MGYHSQSVEMNVSVKVFQRAAEALYLTSPKQFGFSFIITEEIYNEYNEMAVSLWNSLRKENKLNMIEVEFMMAFNIIQEAYLQWTMENFEYTQTPDGGGEMIPKADASVFEIHFC